MQVQFKIHGAPSADAAIKVEMLGAYALATLRDTFRALGVEVPVSAIPTNPKTGYRTPEEAWQAIGAAVNQATLLLGVSCAWDFIPTAETTYDDALAGRCRDAMADALAARAAQ